MDIFTEQLVKKSTKGKDLLLRILIVVAAIFLFIVIFLFSPYILGQFSTIGILIGFGVLYGGYYLFTSQNIEYEYSVTNGEMDVDKIVSQRKRTRLATVRCREVENIGPYKKAEHVNRQYGKVIKACESEDDEANTWYLTFRSPDKGNTLLVFSPNKKVLGAIKTALPRLLQKNVQVWD